MKIFKNKTVVTIICGIVCVAILAVAYYFRVNKKINATSIPVAKEDLPARHQITSDDIDTTVKIAASGIPNNVYRNTADIIGKYVDFNTRIPKGSFFYTSAIVTWDEMPDSAWEGIGDDQTIVSLPVNNTKTYGNSIYPGDKIDLYYQTYDNNKLVFGKLISAITVLAVKDSSGYHINEKSENQNDAVALIFAVSEEYHLLIRKISYLGEGNLIPVPRNEAYSKSDREVSVSSDYLVGLVNKRCSNNFPLDVDTTSNTNIVVSE